MLDRMHVLRCFVYIFDIVKVLKQYVKDKVQSDLKKNYLKSYIVLIIFGVLTFK